MNNKTEIKIKKACVGQDGGEYHIAGKSKAILDTIDLARKVAPTSTPVLITGESGTGKELVSHLIYRQSTRSEAPYVKVNCAALSESLLESELFGHEKGAFTGAHSRHKGRFERAGGGTILLDEISETCISLQAKLLRVLEQQDFERVGGSELVSADVRIICTSNRDMAAEVEKGRFRKDLYYRMSGLQLTIPPLRRRPEDIAVLTWHFVKKHAAEVGRKITAIAPQMLQTLNGYHWPGNVRQLRNVVRTALITSQGPILSLEGCPALVAEICGGFNSDDVQDLQLRELERRAIFEALRRTKSHQAKAARLLGITDRTLREKLRKYRQRDANRAAGEIQWLRTSA